MEHKKGKLKPLVGEMGWGETCFVLTGMRAWENKQIRHRFSKEEAGYVIGEVKGGEGLGRRRLWVGMKGRRPGCGKQVRGR